MFRTNAGRIGGRVIPGTLSAPGVWSMAEQSTYKRGGDWPGTLDPYYASVRLLLQMNGSNNSTTFTDTSSSPKTVTPFGNAKISTDQSKFDGSSAYFDGDGDYLTLAASSDWNLSSTDFTVECFMYKTENRNGGLISQGVSRWRLRTLTTGTVAWDADGSVRITSGTLAINTWHHIAASRIGATTRLFINGVSAGSTTATPTNTSVDSLFIGAWSGGTTSPIYQGFVDSVRLTSVGRYSTDFTPPSLPFPNG